MDKPWDKQAYDVEIKAGDGNTLFALTKEGSKFSLVKSTDGGLTFETDPEFPTTITDTSGGLLAVTPANPGMLLAVMLSSDNTPYIYKGTWKQDYGACWLPDKQVPSA